MNLDRRRTIKLGDASTTRLARILTESLQFGVDTVLLRIRRVPGLDSRYTHPLRHYLRQAILDRIDDSEAPFTSEINPNDLQRYRRACARLLPSDRELIVARLELGYGYEQLALATDRSFTGAARSAVRRALLRLAEEMDRV